MIETTLIPVPLSPSAARILKTLADEERVSPDRFAAAQLTVALGRLSRERDTARANAAVERRRQFRVVS